MGSNTTNQQGTSNSVTNTNQNQSGTFNTDVTRNPYAPLAPYLDTAIQGAAGTYQRSVPFANNGDPGLGLPSGPGYEYTSVPQTWVNQGIGQNNAISDQIFNAYGLPSAGVSGAARPYWEAIGRYVNPIDNQTQGLLDQYQNNYSGYNPLLSNLNPLAANTSGALTDVQQQILNDNAERLSNRLASQYSGAGRYGSFGAGIGLARGISETNNPLIASFNQQNIQNALNANQLSGGLLGGQQGALGGAGNLYNTAQARAQQYGQMLPGLAQLSLLPGQVKQEAGNYMLNYPWQQARNSASLIASLAPLYGNAGTQNTSGNFNTLTNTLGNTVGTNTSQTSKPTPWTTYAGLGIAGLGLL